MKLSSKNKPNPNFSMSSMTDLIFILLIFFLVTSSSSSIDFLPIDIPSSENPQEIQKDDVNIIVTIKKDISCNKFQYVINNKDEYCGWEETEVALNNYIKKIDLDKEKKFSALILAAQEKTPIDECVHVIDFASKHNYNIGINVDKKEK
jgi:biopolymer transport protein ExbD